MKKITHSQINQWVDELAKKNGLLQKYDFPKNGDLIYFSSFKMSSGSICILIFNNRDKTKKISFEFYTPDYKSEISAYFQIDYSSLKRQLEQKFKLFFKLIKPFINQLAGDSNAGK